MSSIFRFFTLMTFCIVVLTGTTLAQDETTPPTQPPLVLEEKVKVTLKSGDTFEGTFKGFKENQMILAHPLLGTIPVELAEVDKMEAESLKGKPKIWSFKFEGGVAGAQGNSKNFNIRASHSGQRKTERNLLVYEGKYNLGYSENSDTQVNEKNTNQGTIDGRSDWYFKKFEKLSYFISANLLYDEFQDFDFRLAGYTGFGYAWIKTDTTTLTTSVGAGVSREFGGTQDEITPEGIASVSFITSIGGTQEINLYSEIIPEFRDIGEYRWNSKGSYNIYTSTKKNVGMGIGAENRFQSNPGPNTKKNDLTYFASLIVKF